MKILKIVATLGIAAAIISCCPCLKNKSKAKTDLPLTKTEWQLVKVNAMNVTPNENFLIIFNDDMSVNGIGACNRFFGKYSTDKGKIKIGPLGATKMMCPSIKAENDFFNMLEKIDAYTIDGNTLMLLYNGELLGVLEGSAQKAQEKK